MQVISWNVASVRARMPLLKNLLSEQKPDIVFLQEVKATHETFPFREFTEMGYFSVISGQKSFNGVAILSRYPLQEVLTVLPNTQEEIPQARFIQAKNQGLTFISVYVPNGNPPEKDPTDTSRLDYKLKWLDHLKEHLLSLLEQKQSFIIGGDFNVIEKDADVYDPELYRLNALMLPSVRECFHLLTELPICNTIRFFSQEKPLYSFWDFQGGAWYKNNGMLLDHIFISNDLKTRLKNAGIYKEMRRYPKPSDHVPVWCLLE